MPGLVPGIHVFAAWALKENVDGRDKPGHDDKSEIVSVSSVISVMICSAISTLDLPGES